MDTVDLCSDSDETTSHAIQEYDFVGSISNSPKGSIEDVWSASSDETVAWYRPATSGNISPDRDQDSCPSQQLLSHTSRPKSPSFHIITSDQEHLAIIGSNDDPDQVIYGSSETKTTKSAEQQCERESKQMRAAFRVYKPGERLKHMTVECGLDLMEKELFSKVSETLGAAGVKVCPGSGRSCVTWRRDLPPNMSGVKHQEDRHTLVLLEQELVVELLQRGRLTTHLETVLAGRASGACTLLVYGMEPYFRKLKSQQKAKWRSNSNSNRRRSAETEGSDAGQKKPTQTDFNYYMAKLLLEKGVTCQRAESAEDVASVLYHYTKAVAEAPYKKERYQQDLLVECYMRGDNKECVKVDAAGNGCLRLWSQTLCRFPLAGLEVGQAVCDKWQSPRSLHQSLSAPQAITLLSDIPVRRGKGPLAAAKRLGGELANKLYTFYTSLDGDTLLS